MTAHLTATARRAGAPALLGGLYLALVTTFLFLGFAHWAYDDPFITYRYAENLARGAGFVYNSGELIQSTTTPLFTLALALLYPLWPDLPHLANLIGAFSLACGALLLWDLSRTWKTPIAGATALLLYPAFPLLLNTLSSEAPLYLALCLGAFAGYARGRYAWCACCAALAVLARADGILVAAVLSIHYLIRYRHFSRVLPIPWGALAIFLAITAAWFLFAWSYFGTPLPATLAAKQRQGAMAISQQFGPGLLALAQNYLARWYYWIAAALALAGVLHAFRPTLLATRPWLPLLAWVALYTVAYTALGVSRYFWYYAPLAPGIVAAIGMGAQAVSNLIARPVRVARNSRTRMWAAVAAGVLVGVPALAQVCGAAQLRANSDPRVPIYRAAGEWLRANTSAHSAVGALEVGIIGYYARRRMIDFAGLIQPEVAARLTPNATYESSALWATERYRPDFLALVDGVLAGLEQSDVRIRCTVVQRFEGARYQYNRDLSVYACRWPQP